MKRVLYLFLFAFVTACSSSSIESYSKLKRGAYVFAIDSKSVDLVFAEEGKTPVVVNGKLTSQFPVPKTLRGRLLLSISDIYDVETQSCGTLKFVGAMGGHLICSNCEAVRRQVNSVCAAYPRSYPLLWNE